MKICYEKHGVEGIENCLFYLSASDPDSIESDEFEMIGEDEDGREGSADISITNLAEEACKALTNQRKRIAELEAQVEQHKAAEETQIALRENAVEEMEALAAHLGRLSDTWSSVVDAGTFYSPRNLENVMCAVFSDTPATSLDRRDAELLSAPFKDVHGCGDHACVVHKPEGMGTNSGCRCITNRSKAGLILKRLAKLRDDAKGER